MPANNDTHFHHFDPSLLASGAFLLLFGAYLADAPLKDFTPLYARILIRLLGSAYLGMGMTSAADAFVGQGKTNQFIWNHLPSPIQNTLTTCSNKFNTVSTKLKSTGSWIKSTLWGRVSEPASHQQTLASRVQVTLS